MLIESALSKEEWVARFRNYTDTFFSEGDCCIGWVLGRFIKLRAKRAWDFGVRERAFNQVYGRITQKDGKTQIRYFHLPGVPPWFLVATILFGMVYFTIRNSNDPVEYQGGIMIYIWMIIMFVFIYGLTWFLIGLFSRRGQENMKMLDDHLQFISVPPAPEDKKKIPTFFYEREY